MMRKIQYLLLAVVACLFGGLTAAHAEEVNLGDMELGKTYQVGENSYGKFVAPQDGYLLVSSTSVYTLRPYKEIKATLAETVVDENNVYPYTTLKPIGSWQEAENSTPVDYKSQWELQVEKGQVVWLCCGTTLGGVSNVVLSMDHRDFQLMSSNLKENAVVSPTSNTRLSLGFNRPVAYSSAYLLYGGTKMALSNLSESGVTFDLKSAVFNLLSTGQAKTGDVFQVVLEGVTSEDGELIYNGDGKYSIDLTFGVLPTMLSSESANFSKKFKTWWASGAEDGIFTLTFSKNLKVMDNTKAMIRFGDQNQQENGGFYIETALPNAENGDNTKCFTMKVVDNKVILDFTGKRRSIGDMVQTTSGNNPDAFKYINLEVSGIYDEDGAKVYSTTSTTMGKFNYSFELEVPTTDVQWDFTPNNGANIDNADEVEIWIQDEDKLSYQGIDFVYTEGEEEKTITVTDFTKEEDTEAEDVPAVFLRVKIPAEAKGHGKVKVCLHNLTCMDGKDYSNSLAAEYTSIISTGIAGVTTVENGKAMKVYNLSGQQLAGKPSQSGVYIVNGKKMVLKK